MTYGKEARRKFGNFYAFYLKGWQDAEYGEIRDIKAYSEYAKRAYREGRREREGITRQWNSMLIESNG